MLTQTSHLFKIPFTISPHLTSVEIGVPEQHHLRSPLSAQHARDCCAPPAFTVWLSCSSRVIAVKKEMALVTVITIAASSCEQA